MQFFGEKKILIIAIIYFLLAPMQQSYFLRGAPKLIGTQLRTSSIECARSLWSLRSLTIYKTLSEENKNSSWNQCKDNGDCHYSLGRFRFLHPYVGEHRNNEG